MKKIIGFAAATAAVLALAIGIQVFATSGHGEEKRPAAITETTSTPSTPSTTAPSDGSADGQSNGATKQDDRERDGFTEDHSGKPGESK